jgi:hypothetical protein
MLATQGVSQQGNLYPNPTQPQQFNRSPNIQQTQLNIPPNNGNLGMDNAQQLEQFLRMNPDIEKNGNRTQALNQLMMRAKQNGGTVNMGSLATGQSQPQPQQQQQRPHPVGLNGFNPQAQVQAQGSQHQRTMSNQTIQQQQIPQPQQPQLPRSDSYNLASQQNMQYPNPGVDTQRQIEAVSFGELFTMAVN